MVKEQARILQPPIYREKKNKNLKVVGRFLSVTDFDRGGMI